MPRARDSSTCGDAARMVATGGSGNTLEEGRGEMSNGSEALVCNVESAVSELVVDIVITGEGSSGIVGVVLEPSGVAASWGGSDGVSVGILISQLDRYKNKRFTHL